MAYYNTGINGGATQGRRDLVETGYSPKDYPQSTGQNLMYNPNSNNQGNPYTAPYQGVAGPGESPRIPDSPSPLPPGSPQQQQPQGQGPIGPWSLPVPQRGTYSPYTPTTSNPWTNPNNAAGTPWTPGDFNTQALRDQYTAYMQASLPWQQFQQNNYQWGAEFNEAGRRSDRDFGEQQRINDYNMGLSGRQQQLAEWAQQQAANQWGQQFGWQQQNDLFSQDLANRQFNQQDIELARRFGLDQQELQALVDYRNQQDALARWQQGQQGDLARWQTQQQIANQQAMQQAELEAARQNAILQATGRAAGQGPNTQWMRRF